MTPIDKQIIKAIEMLKERGDIEYTKEFCDDIKMDKQTLNNVLIGRSHFRPLHIKAMCKTYGINANWIFGLSDQFSRVNSEVKHMKTGNVIKR
jgi:hypothetical protein